MTYWQELTKQKAGCRRHDVRHIILQFLFWSNKKNRNSTAYPHSSVLVLWERMDVCRSGEHTHIHTHSHKDGRVGFHESLILVSCFCFSSLLFVSFLLTSYTYERGCMIDITAGGKSLILSNRQNDLLKSEACSSHSFISDWCADMKCGRVGERFLLALFSCSCSWWWWWCSTADRRKAEQNTRRWQGERMFQMDRRMKETHGRWWGGCKRVKRWDERWTCETVVAVSVF